MTTTVNSTPAIIQLVYQDGTISLVWAMSGITPATSFQVTIKNDNTGTTNIYSATGFFTKLQQSLTVGVPYSATVAQDDGGTIGPPSPPVPVITAFPTVTLVQNTGAGLLLRWNKVTGYDNYSAALQELGVKSWTQAVTGDNCFFDNPLIGSGYSTGVAAQTADGVSTGPVGQAYTPIQLAPTVLQVQNTGSALFLMWETLTGYSKYQATLQETGSSPDTQIVSDTSYTFPGALSGSSYTAYVAVQSDDGVLVGPPSTAYNPILSAPVMTGVENTGAGLKLSWAQLSGYNRYMAVLQKLGGQVHSQSVVGLTWTFDGTLSGAGYSTDVFAQSDDQVVIGPPSTVYTPIIAQPSLTELDYNADQLGVDWQQVSDPGVTGYLIQITDPNGQVQQFSTANTGHTALAVSLLPVTYAVLIRATNGIVLGPWSAALIPLTAPPAAMMLGFDGTHLRADWEPSGQDNVTGYTVQLLAGGQVIETFNPTAPPQSFASGLNSAVIYTAQARSTGNMVKGPWAALATGPYATLLTYTFDGIGRISEIAWSGAKTQTYTFDSAGNIESVQFT